LTQAFISSKGPDDARYFLKDLQEEGILISDPGVTALSLRFPFFIVETKSSATGGNLYQAQSQSSVSGASALNILGSIEELHSRNNPGTSTDRSEQEHQTESDVATPCESNSSHAPLVFSVTTEGPIHELWAHFLDTSERSFCMARLGIWCTSEKAGALELTHKIAAILDWKAGNLKCTVVERLASLV